MLAFALLSALAAPADPISGTWAGTSLCQVHPSPCHDEQAVYHISATVGGHYRFIANKIVGGKEVAMGELQRATFDPATNELVGYTADRNGQEAKWRFHLSGRHLSGRLLMPDGTVFRLIEVEKR